MALALGGIGSLLGGAAGLGSLGLGIAGMVGGSPASNVNLPPTWPGAGGQFTSAAENIPNLGNYNLYQGYLPQVQNTTGSLINNPYAPGYQGAAGGAGNLATGGALNQFGAGNNLYGAGTTALGMAFDPNQSLYNYLQNQNTQQANVENAMAGVATTPYGAGVTDYANQQFNMNWQNNQLQRALAGLSGAGQAYGQAGQMQTQAPTQYLYGGGLPYGTFNTIGGNQIGAATQAGQFGTAAGGTLQQQIQDWINTGQGGGGYGTNVGQLGLQQAQQGYNQMQGYGSSIGSGLGALSNNSLGWGSSSPFAFSQVANQQGPTAPSGGLGLVPPGYQGAFNPPGGYG